MVSTWYLNAHCAFLLQVTETRTGPLGCSNYDNLDSVSSVLVQSPENKVQLLGKLSCDGMGCWYLSHLLKSLDHRGIGRSPGCLIWLNPSEDQNHQEFWDLYGTTFLHSSGKISDMVYPTPKTIVHTTRHPHPPMW